MTDKREVNNEKSDHKKKKDNSAYPQDDYWIAEKLPTDAPVNEVGVEAVESDTDNKTPDK